MKEFKTPERVLIAQRALAAANRALRELNAAQQLARDSGCHHTHFAFESAKTLTVVAVQWTKDNLKAARKAARS